MSEKKRPLAKDSHTYLWDICPHTVDTFNGIWVCEAHNFRSCAYNISMAAMQILDRSLVVPSPSLNQPPQIRVARDKRPRYFLELEVRTSVKKPKKSAITEAIRS